METLVEKKKYTYQEYLQLEKQSDVRYEFWNGEVFASESNVKICLYWGDLADVSRWNQYFSRKLIILEQRDFFSITIIFSDVTFFSVQSSFWSQLT